MKEFLIYLLIFVIGLFVEEKLKILEKFGI